MGKKSCCCKKSSSTKCADSSSSSCTSGSSKSSCTSGSSSSSCSSSKSSSSKSCCLKYPKCHCKVNKCAPIYYPNNCIGHYPCGSIPNRLERISKCASSIHNSYSSIITGNAISFNLLLVYTIYIVNPTDASGNLYLPAINSLNICSYNKTFIISNISSYAITINPSTTTITTDNINGSTSVSIPANSSVTIYSSYINGIGYWILVN